MEDSFTEDTPVVEKGSGDSFVEDSFVADVPEKKNSTSQSQSGSGTSKSMAEAVGFGAPSASKINTPFVQQIKKDNVKQLDLDKSEMLKQGMAKALRDNPSPVYKEHYIKTLASKGYDKDALEHYAYQLENQPMVEDKNIDLSQQQEGNPTPVEAEKQHFEQSPAGKETKQWDENYVGRALNVLPNTIANSITGIAKGAEQFSKGMNTLGTKMIESKGEYAKEPLSVKLKDMGTGMLNAGAGALKAGFSGAGLVVPELAAFNLAIGEIEALPEDVKAGLVNTLSQGLNPGTKEEQAKQFDTMINFPFAAATTIADHLGYKPKEGSAGAAILDIANVLLTIGAMKVGGEAKNLSTAIDYTDAMNEFGKGGGVATKQQLQKFSDINDAIKDISLGEVKDAIEKNAIPQDEHDLHDKLAELQAKTQDKSFDTLTPEAQDGIFNDIKETQKALKIKAGEDMMNASLAAHNEAKVQEIDDAVKKTEESLKNEDSPAVKTSIEQTLENLKNQRKDAIQKQSATGILPREQSEAGGTGSERERVGQSEQGVKTPEEIKVQEEVRVRQNSASILVAPFFDSTVGSSAEAGVKRDTQEYKKYAENLHNIADQLGVKASGINDNIGGFENSAGKKIVEVSNRVNVDSGDFEKTKQYAAIVGALSPEVQESTIAARALDAHEVGGDKHTADEHIIAVDNIDGTIKALKEAGIDDYTLDETNGTLHLLDFDKEEKFADGEKLTNLVNKLKENGVKYGEHERRPIESEYIDSEKRHTILTGLRESVRGTDMELQKGGDKLRATVDEAIRRNTEFRNKKGLNENLQDESESGQAKSESISEKEKSEADARAVELSGRNTQRRAQAKASLTKLRDDGLLVSADNSLIGKAKKLLGKKPVPMSDAEINAQMSLLDAMSDVWKNATGKDNFYDTFLGDIQKGDIANLKAKGGALFQDVESPTKPITAVTLGVFNDPAFEKMKGKDVAMQAITDLMKSRGKQIEKDIISEVLNYDKYKEQKRINFDEFRADVDTQVMKLEKIKSDSYATYGKDNPGDNADYGDAETVIFNAPVEHGEKGHFPNDFDGEGLDKKEWAVQQIPGTEVWVAKDKNMPEGTAGADIQNYVGTAGSRREVEKWVSNRKASNKKGVNVGLFGHIRTWFNKSDGIFHIAELQSDYFQKNKATDLLAGKIPEDEITAHVNVTADNYNKELAQKVKDKFGLTVKVDGDTVAAYDKEGNLLLSDTMGEPIPGLKRGDFEKSNIIVRGLNELGRDNPEAREFYDNIREEYNTENRIRKEKAKSEYIAKHLEEAKKKPAPLALKQFVASQKVHEIRLFKEAIKHAADSGAETVRFPAPHTIAVIEGYVDKSGAGNAPYEIIHGDSDRLSQGDTIEYGGDRMTVVESDRDTITVVPEDECFRVSLSEEISNRASDDMYEVESTAKRHFTDLEAITKEEVESFDADGGWRSDSAKELLKKYFEENPEEETVKWSEIEDDLRNDIEEGYNDYSVEDLMGYSEAWHAYGDEYYVAESSRSSETFNQPDGYEGSSDKEGYYDDLSKEQKTVVDKYKELGDAMKKMRPDAEEVVDDNDMNWIETKITDADRTNPIIAFQNEGAKVKGAIDFLNDNKATVHLFDGADITTLAHEITGHLGRRVLEKLAGQDAKFAKDYETVKKWAGVKDEQWTTNAEEKFARGFERYLREGKAPTKALNTVFASLKSWLSAVYKTIKGSSIDVDLTPEIRKVFDNLLNGEKNKKPDTGISKEMRAKQRAELGLPEPAERPKNMEEHTWKALNKEANRLVDSGEVDYNKLAEEITAGETPESDLNNAILNRGVTELGNKIIDALEVDKNAKANGDKEASDAAQDEWAEHTANLAKIQTALEEGLRKAARTLSSAQQSMKADYTIGGLYKKAQKIFDKEKVPRELMSSLAEDGAKIQELTTRIKALEDVSEAQGKEIEDLKKSKPATSAEKIQKIREKRASIFDEWNKYSEDQKKGPTKQGGLPFNEHDIAFAARIVGTYVEQGFVTTMDAAKKLKADVKKYTGKNISDEDIAKIFDTEVEGKKVIDGFENTGIPKSKQDLYDLGAKALDETINPKDKKERTKKSEEEKALIANTGKALLDLKVARAKLKRKVDNKLAAVEFAKKSRSEKAWDAAVNIMNLPRSLMASFDFSAPLRQGLVASAAHPVIASKAFAGMFKQAFSEKAFDKWLYEYKESPEWELAKKSGLYVADPHEFLGKLNGREEAFMSNLGEKLPLGIGKGIAASERGYIGYLNKLRTDIFKQGTEQLQSQGKSFESHPKEFEALADFINSATGRGKSKSKTIEDAMPLLNAAFFSPRLIKSRMNLLNPRYYYKMPPAVRLMALKDMGKFMGFAATVLTVAAAAGAQVERDPRSSDFLKVKVGDTRYDVLGGFQQYLHLAAMMAPAMIGGGQKKTEKGMIDLTKPNWQKQTRAAELLKFVRNKTSPAVGMAWDFLEGSTTVPDKDDQGKPIPLTLSRELATHLTPLQAQDAYAAYNRGGMPAVFATMIPSMFGVGVQTYSNKKSDAQLQKEFLKFTRQGN